MPVCEFLQGGAGNLVLRSRDLGPMNDRHSLRHDVNGACLQAGMEFLGCLGDNPSGEDHFGRHIQCGVQGVGRSYIRSELMDEHDGGNEPAHARLDNKTAGGAVYDGVAVAADIEQGSQEILDVQNRRVGVSSTDFASGLPD